MSRSKSSIRLLFALGLLWLAAACFGQTLDFKLESGAGVVRQGKRLQVVATVKNTGTVRLYLNQITLTFSGAQGVDLETAGFETSFEGALEPGATKTGPLFELLAAADAPPANVSGVVAVLGGPDEEATANLGQRELTVSVVAEPAPETRIVSGLADGFVACATSTTFTFVGEDNETPVAELKYRWRIDEGIWTNPSSETTASLTNLGQGPHKFEVAAIDGLGKIDPSPEVRNFTVDLRPLEMSVPAVTEVSADSARCVWRTNRAGSSKVEYRKLSEATWQTLEVAGRSDAHIVVLTGLDSTTDYRVKLVTVDDCGSIVASVELPFRTLRTKVLLATPDVQTVLLKPGIPFERDILLQNIAEVSLPGLRMAVENLPSNVTLSLIPPASLAAGARQTVRLSLLAADETVLTASPRIRISSAEGDEALLTLDLRIVPRRPQLEIAGSFSGSMLRGVSRIVELKVTNTGDVAATDLRVSLPAAPWLHLSSAATIARIAPGESTTLSLNLTPASTLALGPYTGTIALNGDNAQASLPFNFLCASTGKGSVRITATDERTYFQDPTLKVQNATVVLTDRNTKVVVAEGTTDEKGEFTTGQIPEGSYNVAVTEVNHGTFNGTAKVEAGAVVPVETFMTMNRLTYNWTVAKEPVEDHYVALVDVLFETHVPAPVLTIFPASVDVRTLTFDSSGYASVRFTITNHGQINLNGVGIVVGGSSGGAGGGSGGGYSIEGPGGFGTLGPGSSVSGPFRLRREPVGGNGSGGGLPCDISIVASGTYACGREGDRDRQVRVAAPAYIRVGDCPSPPSAPVGGIGGGGSVRTEPSVSEPSTSTNFPTCECFPAFNFCISLPDALTNLAEEFVETSIKTETSGLLEAAVEFNAQFCLETCCENGRFTGYRGKTKVESEVVITVPKLQKEIPIPNVAFPGMSLVIPDYGEKSFIGVFSGKLTVNASPKFTTKAKLTYEVGCGTDCLTAHVELDIQQPIEATLDVTGTAYIEGIGLANLTIAGNAGLYLGAQINADYICGQESITGCFDGLYFGAGLNIKIESGGKTIYDGPAFNGKNFRYYIICPDACGLEKLDRDRDKLKIIGCGRDN